ncbi:MAG: hypothetical protein PHH27_03105, partial [Candidatus Colwellbacteria bacterium]|nr:hypothetical protein [Candidatus Colwellbacteria bacterium]
MPRTKKLKIATMVTSHYPTPAPKGVIYAPMDIAIELTEGLSAKGHKIDFFGSKGTKVPGANRIIDCGLEPLLGKKGQKILEGYGSQNIERGKIFGLWDQHVFARMFQEPKKRKYDLLHIDPK